MKPSPMRAGLVAATPVLAGSQKRAQQAKLRKLAISKAGGVCASCDVDVEALRLIYEAERGRVLHDHPPITREGWDPSAATPENLEMARRAAGLDAALAVDQRWKALGFKRGAPTLECEHVVAIWDGGGNDISNTVALCRPCHRKRTSEDAGIRAEKPAKRVGRVGQKAAKEPRRCGPVRRGRKHREVGDRCPTCSRKGLVAYATCALFCDSCGQVVPIAR